MLIDVAQNRDRDAFHKVFTIEGQVDLGGISSLSVVQKILRKTVRVKQERLSPILAIPLPPRFDSRHCLNTSLACRCYPHQGF